MLLMKLIDHEVVKRCNRGNVRGGETYVRSSERKRKIWRSKLEYIIFYSALEG